MTKILDRLPLLSRKTAVRFGSRTVAFRRDQILVWIGISLRGESDPNRISPKFPALIDTGNGCDAYLSAHHLVHWAGIDPAMLSIIQHLAIHERAIPCHEADVWIFPNRPGTHELLAGSEPFRLELDDGIAVAPHTGDHPVEPRLPLLGLSAFRKNRLDFCFHSATTDCTLRTANWRTRLLRWLA